MRTVLVSGASAGLGRAIAQELDRASCADSFVLLGRNLKRLKETRDSLRHADRHEIVSVDMTDAARIRAAFKRLRPKLTGLFAVIANAGIAPGNDGPDERWREVLDTNLTGTYRIIHEALPALRSSRHEYRHVVMISSGSALGHPGATAYSASKAGLLGLTRTLAMELAPEKILVNAICPGPVRTGLAALRARELARSLKITEKSAWAMMSSGTLLKKACDPGEVGRLAGFLISEGQVSITGKSIEIGF